MRYGVLSDIHGNVEALRASIADLRRAGVDVWICAGDIVGYGPNPNDCIELIAELGGSCVLGNHELLALGRRSTERSGSLCRTTTPWTRSVLTAASRSYIALLPTVDVVEDVVVAHGSLADPEEYVRTPKDHRRQLRLLRESRPEARVLVLGHTHHPTVLTASGAAPRPGRGEPVMVNPGSVGQSRLRERRPLARHLLIDTARGVYEPRAVPYDVPSTVRALRASGLPPHSIHIRPGVVAKVRRRCGQVLRAVHGGERRMTREQSERPKETS